MSANGVSGAHGADRTGAAAAAPPSVELGDVTFGSVLRAINPLQYLPLVGTIYRVSTGDAAPSGLRTAVSAVVGVLTGGPIGLVTSILGSLAEQFFHVEDRMREAWAGPPASPATAPSGPMAQAHSPVGSDDPVHEAGRMDGRKVASAYAEARLLGAI